MSYRIKMHSALGQNGIRSGTLGLLDIADESTVNLINVSAYLSKNTA
jgi:hypothetical protein